MTRDVSNREYQDIHTWMRRTHGKACLCENPDCKKKSTHYEWALKKGKRYGRNKRLFLQLCKPYHMLYDMTDEWREKIRKAGTGRKRPDLSVKMAGNQHARKIPAIISCRWCKTLFKPKDVKTRFCSKSCVMQARNEGARRFLTTLT